MRNFSKFNFFNIQNKIEIDLHPVYLIHGFVYIFATSDTACKQYRLLPTVTDSNRTDVNRFNATVYKAAVRTQEILSTRLQQNWRYNCHCIATDIERNKNQFLHILWSISVIWSKIWRGNMMPNNIVTLFLVEFSNFVNFLGCWNFVQN